MNDRQRRPGLMRIPLVVLAGLGAFVMTSCSWTRFSMQEAFSYPVRTVVLTRPNTVKRTHENGFEMKGPVRVGMRSERLTHGLFSTEIIRHSTSPIIIQTRTTPYDDSVLSDHGVIITIAGDSTVIEREGRREVFSTPVPIGAPFVVEIRNFGRTMSMRVHHTDFGTLTSRLHCTEWVIVSVRDTSRIFVGDPWFTTSI